MTDAYVTTPGHQGPVKTDDLRALAFRVKEAAFNVLPVAGGLSDWTRAACDDLDRSREALERVQAENARLNAQLDEYVADGRPFLEELTAVQAENARLRDALSVFARGGLVAIVADARDNGRAKHSDWGRGYADACDDILKWLGASSVVPKEETP